MKAPTVQIEDLRANDVRRHEVGGELDTSEHRVGKPGECLGQQCFGRAGYAFEQDVAPAEKCENDLLEYIILADDNFGGLLADGRIELRNIHGIANL